MTQRIELLVRFSMERLYHFFASALLCLSDWQLDPRPSFLLLSVCCLSCASIARYFSYLLESVFHNLC